MNYFPQQERFLQAGPLLAFLPLVFFLFLQGCASPGDARKAVAHIPQPAVPETAALRGAVGQIEVREAAGYDGPASGAAALHSALDRYFTEAGILGAPDSAGYRLAATLEEMDEPWAGTDMTVTARVRYELIEAATGSAVYAAEKTHRYTATMDTSLDGAHRIRIARAGAFRSGIGEVMGELLEQPLQLASRGAAPSRGSPGRDAGAPPPEELLQRQDPEPEPAPPSPSVTAGGKAGEAAPAGPDLSLTALGAGERERIEEAIAWRSEVMDEMRGEFETLWARRDELERQLNREFGIEMLWVGVDDSIDDSINDRIISYCWDEYGQRAWESDPWRMEERCERELRQKAGPRLAEYKQVADTISAKDRDYGRLLDKRHALTEAYAHLQATGEVNEDLAAFLSSPDEEKAREQAARAGPETGGGAGEMSSAEAAAQCTRKDALFDRLGAQLMRLRSGDDCDSHKSQYLLNAWALDLTQTCRAAGTLDVPDREVQILEGNVRQLAANMERIEAGLRCSAYHPDIENGIREWGPF